MKSYVKKQKDNGIFQSMSRKGNCLDHSLMENYFGIMKQEMYYGKVYHSFEELMQAVIKYIFYYNNERIKAKLTGMRPVEYRLYTSQLTAKIFQSNFRGAVQIGSPFVLYFKFLLLRREPVIN